ncbi:MAG: class I adenylate-forming enzyme family protein [Chloroflexota bacterium]
MLYRALENSAKHHPEKIAVVGTRCAYTFAELQRQTRGIARYFQEHGLGPGDHLLAGIPPSPEFYALFIAAAALGIVTIPVLPTGKVPDSIKAVQSPAVAGTKDFVARLSAGGIAAKHTLLWHARQGLALALPDGEFARKKIIRREAVLGTSSSGTTGEPVIFLRSAEYLYRRARMGAIAWRIAPDDTMLSTGPFTSGLNTTNHLVLPIVQGLKTVVLENFHRRQVIDAIARERVTVLFTVPMVFDLLARLPAAYNADLSSLRRCISGGTHLPRDIYDRFYRRFGLRLAQGYGGAHFVPAFTVNLNGSPGAVGRKNGLFPVKIVDAKGKIVAAGAVGEIVFDISQVKYAWAKAVLQRNANRRDGYVYTGDLGRLDEDGNLFVIGRISRVVKVGANRVAPAEVEDALRAHPRVKDAVVFPVRPGQPDEAVAAVVVPNGAVTSEELVNHCARSLDAYKCPQTISFRGALPRNAHGKVIRYLYDHPSE